MPMCYTVILEQRMQGYFRQRMLAAGWPVPSSVHGMTTLRSDPDNVNKPATWLDLGVRNGRDVLAGAGVRDDLAWCGGLPSPPHWLHQVHGTRVLTFDHACLRRDVTDRDTVTRLIAGEPEADAAVTRTPGVVLAILTADCLPVLFCADDGSEIAAAHAGWRGLAAGVLENTLAAMRTPCDNIMAWLGPAIAARSYEVGDEVRDAFLAHDPGAASAFASTRPGHWSCDLYELARQRLRAAGVTRVFDGGFDTFTDARLHSYRRDGAHSGRMASLLWLES